MRNRGYPIIVVTTMVIMAFILVEILGSLSPSRYLFEVKNFNMVVTATLELEQVTIGDYEELIKEAKAQEDSDSQAVALYQEELEQMLAYQDFLKEVRSYLVRMEAELANYEQLTPRFVSAWNGYANTMKELVTHLPLSSSIYYNIPFKNFSELEALTGYMEEKGWESDQVIGTLSYQAFMNIALSLFVLIVIFAIGFNQVLLHRRRQTLFKFIPGSRRRQRFHYFGVPFLCLLAYVILFWVFFKVWTRFELGVTFTQGAIPLRVFDQIHIVSGLPIYVLASVLILLLLVVYLLASDLIHYYVKEWFMSSVLSLASFGTVVLYIVPMLLSWVFPSDQTVPLWSQTINLDLLPKIVGVPMPLETYGLYILALLGLMAILIYLHNVAWKQSQWSSS